MTEHLGQRRADEGADQRRERGSLIQSVDRAAPILKVLAAGRRLAVTEIAKRLDLPPPTVHGLLRTLVAHGFVEQDRTSQKYQLGPGVLHLGRRIRTSTSCERARSAGPTGSPCTPTPACASASWSPAPCSSSTTPSGPTTTCTSRRSAPSCPCTRARSRKAVLAFAAPEAVDDLVADGLPRLTHRTLDARGLRAELADVARTGVARERDEAVLGESSVAAPIFDAGSMPVGAIGVVGDTSRLLPRGRSARGARHRRRDRGARRLPRARRGRVAGAANRLSPSLRRR